MVKTLERSTSAQLLPSPVKCLKARTRKLAPLRVMARKRNPMIWCHRILAGRTASGKVCLANRTEAPMICFCRAGEKLLNRTTSCYQLRLFLLGSANDYFKAADKHFREAFL